MKRWIDLQGGIALICPGDRQLIKIAFDIDGVVLRSIEVILGHMIYLHGIWSLWA